MSLMFLRRGPRAVQCTVQPLLQDLRAVDDTASRFARPNLARRRISTPTATSDDLLTDATPAPISLDTPPAPTTTAHSFALKNDARIVESKHEALSLLRAQPIHYVVASLVGKTLLLHARDLFTLPRLKEVEVGDVLELDRIHEVGSRDYTLRAQDPMSTRMVGAVALMRRSVPTLPGPPGLNTTSSGTLVESQSWAARLRPSGLAHVGALLSKNTVRVRCTVVEHTKGPMELIIKKRRRKGYKKTIRHKQSYTRLRVESILIGGESDR